MFMVVKVLMMELLVQLEALECFFFLNVIISIYIYIYIYSITN